MTFGLDASPQPRRAQRPLQDDRRSPVKGGSERGARTFGLDVPVAPVGQVRRVPLSFAFFCPAAWAAWVTVPLTAAEEAALRRCGRRREPFGGEGWAQRTVASFDPHSTRRPPGRPRKPARVDGPLLFDFDETGSRPLAFSPPPPAWRRRNRQARGRAKEKKPVPP